MRYKTVESTPYTHTYCAFNKHTGDTYGDFDCLTEAVDFAVTQPRRHVRQTALSYTRKRESDQLYENVTYTYDTEDGGHKYRWQSRRRVVLDSYHYPAPDWLIVNDLGEAVDKSEVEAARRSPWRNRSWEQREAKYALKGTRLTRIKGSGDKVKANCEQVPCTWRLGDFDNLVRGYHRSPQTTNEKRQNAAHVDEYGWEVVRGRRRCLPSNYDDRPVSIWRSEDSWKHHSKRRKQWKPKITVDSVAI